jgi:hypothetical protein
LPERPQYSVDEWAEIERSVEAVREGIPLTEHERWQLVQVGFEYLMLLHGEEFLVQFHNRAVSNWANIGNLAGQLVEELIEADERSASKRFRSLIKRLEKLRDEEKLGTETTLAHERRDARRHYFRQVLSFWMKLGGELKYSRNPHTKKLGGPLIRFFQTVTNPVLGDQAPALESVKDIIEREHRLLMGKP